MKLGATGEFPQGKISGGDEGALNMAIAADKDAQVVRLVFGTPVAWIGLPKEHALALAKLLVKRANELL